MRSLLVALALVAACDPPPPPRPPEVRAKDDGPALAALRAGDFAGAGSAAGEVLRRDPYDAQMRATRALATYVPAADQLASQLRRVMEEGDPVHAFDHAEGRRVWTEFLGRLEDVDRDLEVAERDPDFSLELCVACWPAHDWNHNGRIDDGDRHLFEIETDGQGSDLPPGDARRTPTFRLDHGDIEWARAMVAFQHAGVELVLAYRWSELDKLLRGDFAKGERIAIHLLDADRVTRARKDLLAGIALSAKERAAYLAETDDDREWVPNPRQKSHPMPLPVDDQLYRRWDELLGDTQRLLASDEGLALRDVARIVDGRAALLVPDAYVDVGKMLREPQDFVIDLDELEQRPPPVEKMLRELLGHGYAEHMRPSPLVDRLRLMWMDVDGGQDTLEHKLHYLVYLN